MKVTIYNYSTGDSFEKKFPMNDREYRAVMSLGEVMVDDSDLVPIDGMVTIAELNNFAKLVKNRITDKDLKVLGKTYLLNEISEGLQNNGFTIINFDEETQSWSCSDFCSESDKGRVLYDLQYAAFPTEVPEALEEYMDYSMLYRNASINMGIREVVSDNTHYLVFKN